MSLGGSKSKSTTNQTSNTTSSSTGTQTKSPWAEVTPYITGDNGVLKAGADLFAQSGAASPQLQGALADLTKAGQANAQTAAGLAGSLTPALQVKGQYITDKPTVTAAQVDPRKAFATLGDIDPSAAFKDLLSGDVTNTYIDKQLAANTDATKAAFADLTADAAKQLSTGVLPGTRSAANIAGQYGGSRQGIAEGVARGEAEAQLNRSAAGLAANLAQTNAGVLSGAYEAAQGRKAGAASGLGDLATGVAVGNADRDLAAQTTNARNALDTSMFNVSNDADLNKFNAGVTLDNNAQRIAAAQAGSGLTGDAYSQILQGLTGANSYNTQQLGQWADLLGSFAGLGGTTNTNETSNETTTGSKTTKGKASEFGLKFNDLDLSSVLKAMGG